MKVNSAAVVDSNLPLALYIEDSPEYRLLVRAALSGMYRLVFAGSSVEAFAAVHENKFALILIDVGLPGRDGLSICSELRKNSNLTTTPMIFVTGRNDANDLVQGFEVGADDYIRKPFDPNELRARVTARMKKSATPQNVNVDEFRKGNLKFQVGRQAVVMMNEGAERELDLTPNEFKILFYLARNEGKTVTRADVLREVWGEKLHVIERTVDKHICSLRRKMDTSSHFVISIPGEGYQFSVDTEPELHTVNR
jgi:two-component system alkaline phosphatase synthesis response regulator PhoP